MSLKSKNSVLQKETEEIVSSSKSARRGVFIKTMAVIFYCLLIIILACATFIEDAFGSDFSRQYIYGSAWFVALWTILALIGVVAIVGQKMWKNLPRMAIHTSLLLILLGAAITFFFGERGYVHLSEGESTDFFVEEESNQMSHFLNFELKLDSFQITYHPGTESPADYSSYVSVREKGQTAQSDVISMNHILSVNGYRFYQTSFDNDGRGTLLSVNHDVWGIAITYAGYMLFALSVLLLLFTKRGTFRKLLSHPMLRKTAGILLLFCVLPLSAQTQTHAQEQQPSSVSKKLPVLARSTADSLAYRQIVYQNRVAPFGTMAHDVMQKLYGETTYKGFSAEQVVGSLILYPEVWHFEPLLKIKSDQLCQILGLQTHYASMANLYENGRYKLQDFTRTANNGNSSSSSISPQQKNLNKAIAQTDEKAALLIMLSQGTLFKPLPENSTEALSIVKVKAELLYNRLNFSGLLFKINLSIGLLAFFMFVLGVMRNRRYRWMIVIAYIQAIGAFAALTLALGLRWYISGHIPLTNGYETMMFVAWLLLLLSFILRQKSDLVPAAGLLLSGFMLLVSSIGSANPQITTLMPVLMSPWLSSHVSMIMISYALFGFMALNGIAALLLHLLSNQGRQYAEKLYVISRLLLYPAVGCLGIGIFLGAVWANVSWGRYWGWDPKEVWALITMLVYALGFHSNSLRCLQRPLFFHLFSIVALLTVIMTYFGVNLLFSGMHSYGG